MRASDHSEAPGSAGDGGERGDEVSLRCGDCHSALDSPAEQAASGAPDGEFYCPLCAAPIDAPLRCTGCGSAICPACGTPLELADELGIG